MRKKFTRRVSDVQYSLDLGMEKEDLRDLGINGSKIDLAWLNFQNRKAIARVNEVHV